VIYQALLCIDGGPLPARVTRYIRNPYRRVWATDEARLDEIDSTTVEELKQFLLKPKQPPVEQAPAPRIA
jgi:hypothetical protein